MKQTDNRLKITNGTLILLRGLPGSGKSSFAKTLNHNGNHFEADMYFYKDGKYNFNPDELFKAHSWCFNKTKYAMQQNQETIVVSNTFTRKRELAQYMELANEFNYKVVSLIVENRHGNESIHNVPKETMEKMRNRFDIEL